MCVGGMRGREYSLSNHIRCLCQAAGVIKTKSPISPENIYIILGSSDIGLGTDFQLTVVWVATFLDETDVGLINYMFASQINVGQENKLLV